MRNFANLDLNLTWVFGKYLSEHSSFANFAENLTWVVGPVLSAQLRRFNLNLNLEVKVIELAS